MLYSKTRLLRSAGDQQSYFVINVLRCIVYNEVPTNEMKTSLYPNLIHLFAELQQMKNVRLINSNFNILMACFMFDF